MDKTLDQIIEQIEELVLEGSNDSIWIDLDSIDENEVEKMRIVVDFAQPDTSGNWFCFGRIKEIFPLAPVAVEDAIAEAIELFNEEKNEYTDEELLEDWYSRNPSLLSEEEREEIIQQAKDTIFDNLGVADTIFYLPGYIKENLSELTVSA